MTASRRRGLRQGRADRTLRTRWPDIRRKGRRYFLRLTGVEGRERDTQFIVALRFALLTGRQAALRVVPEHEFQGVGGQVELAGEMVFPVFPRIMSQQGDGDDERRQAVMVVRYHFQQFLLFIG